MVDEAMFVPADVYKKLIFPMVSKGHTALVCLSTLEHSYDAFCMQLIESKLLPCAQFALVCDACMATGVVTEVCKHRYTSQPPWASAGKRSFLKKMYGNDTAVYDVEIKGIVKKQDYDDIHCFSRDKVEQAIAMRVVLPQSVPAVYVAIDPCGGSNPARGTKSHYAIGAAIPPMTMVRYGAFDANVGSPFVDLKIKQFLTELRSSKVFENALIVFGVESGTGMEDDRIERLILDNFLNVKPMSHFGYKKGIKMDHRNKETMVINLANAFRLDMVRIADCIPVNDMNIRLLREELLRFKVYKEQPKDPNKPVSIKYHGKENGKTDDLAVVTCWCYFLITEYLLSTKNKPR